MITTIYLVLLIFSAVFTLAYTVLWKKGVNEHLTMIFIFTPITMVGFLLYSMSETLEGAIHAENFIYLGTVFLAYAVFRLVMDVCELEVAGAFRLIYFVAALLIYLTSLTAGTNIPIFYSFIHFERVDDVAYLIRGIGFMLWGYYALIGVLLLISIVILIYTLAKPNTVSKKLIFLLLGAEIVNAVCVLTGWFVSTDFDIVAIGYVIAQAMCFILMFAINTRTVSVEKVLSEESEDGLGLIVFDKSFHFLGSNEAAQQMIPDLVDMRVDTAANKSAFILTNILPAMKQYAKNSGDSQIHYTKEDREYTGNIDDFYDGKIKGGYVVSVWKK